MKKTSETALLNSVKSLLESIHLYELARTDANGREYNSRENDLRGRENDLRGRENEFKSQWPKTDAEVRAFQQSHKQLDGKPLVVDGDIGPQTMQSLAAAGIQPPPGWSGLKSAAPTGVTPPKVTPPTGNTAPKVTPPTMQRQQSDPKVVAIQQALMAKGWPLQPTGIMDQNTSDAYEAQFKTDSMNNSLNQSVATNTPTDPTQKAAYDAAVKNMDPNQTPAPAFQSRQAPAAQPSSGWDQNDPDTPAMFRSPLPGEPGMHESVSFKNEESLARIVQLVNW